MFKNLLANLPFNPSLIDQVSFYYGRLRQEAAIRRLGFMFMVAALVVQFIATLYPAQLSLAASPNDVLDGISTKNDILRGWDANTHNTRDIYSRFGITRQSIADISGQNPNTTISSTGRNYWSIGHLPLSAFGINGNSWGERSVNANGTIIYERPLHAWDTHGSSSYAAFHGRNQFGQDFWILKTCGNPTFAGPYLPTPPTPHLSVHKSLLTSSVVHRGDTVKFRLEYQNTKPDSLATNFQLKDTLNNNFNFVSLNDMSSKDGNTLVIRHSGQLGYSAVPYVSTLVVKVRDAAANGALLCNSATVSSDQSTATSERPCVTVVVPSAPTPPPPAPSPPPPTPAPTPPPPLPSSPSGYCVVSSSFMSGSNMDFTVHTDAYVKNAQVAGYSYDVDANGSIDAQDKTTAVTYDKQFTNLATGPHTILVYVQINNGQAQASQTPACQAQINIAEAPRVNLSKSVTNITHNNSDANGTTVQNGDILEFKLDTQNVTTSDYKNYNGQDYFGSVLQYADLADPSQLAKQGLSLDSQNYLHWHIDDLKANASDIKTIQVKVKNIIPSTNTPSTLSPDYNCKITNDYGNEVTMSVNCPAVKTVEQAAISLPNTGPGASLAAGTIVAVVVGYFFSRARIMGRELAIIRSEYTASGGL